MAHVVSFYSFKGGVGRSMLLANVAVQLAGAGKRVACIDFDLEAGGLHTIFGLSPKHIKITLLDLVCDAAYANVSRAVQDLTDRLPKSGSGGKLLLLPTVSEITRLNEALESRRDFPTILGRFIREIEEEYRPHFVLIDSRSGFSEMASASLIKAKSLVCVSRPNKQSMEGLRLLLDVLVASRDQKQIYHALSQVPDVDGIEKRIRELESVLGNHRKFHAVIPYAPELALDEQVVTLTAPKCLLAKSYSPIAELLNGGRA